uniref:RING-type E3 ubiquitin transferase n=1 Tax=Zonotrichia albicollis TaxID=44394 RepID=A0A8D2MKY7_ZONAL
GQQQGAAVSRAGSESLWAASCQGSPQSKAETKTSPVAQSPQAGKELKQKGTSSTVKVSVSEIHSIPLPILSCSSVSRNEGVTVYFHAILSKDFKFDPGSHKVFIRAQGIPSYAEWEDNICELECTRPRGKHGYLIEGAVTLSREIVDKYIPYKYWVTCGEGEYEFIYKNPVSNNPVNRCLLINRRFLKNGVWHQYDDIVCAKPSMLKNFQQKVGFDNNKEVAKGKKIAAKIMLESIFSILATRSPDNLRNFFCQLKQFHYVAVGQLMLCLVCFFSSLSQVKDLLLKYVKKIALPFLTPEAAPEGRVIQSKLAVGLTILVVVEHYSLSIPKSDLADLCSLLCLDQVSPQLFFYSVSLFCFLFLFSLRIDLTNLCQRCIELDVDQWVWVLPLLHSFAAPLQQEHRLVEEDAWAGLEGLPFAETRMKATRMLARMREKRYLMEFDGTLVKSWLCVVPLGSLADFIKDFSSDPLVTLQGVLYRLENAELSCDSSQVCHLAASPSSALKAPTGLLDTDTVGPQSLTCPCPLCVPWQMHNNLLEQISAYNMGKFSQLVSAVMVKSWPVMAGQSEGYSDTILHHLLTWPDIKHIFSFNGSKNLLDTLTDEAKNVVAVADSVLKRVTDDINCRCILVKHLEKVFQHKEQFLCMWETSLKELLALRHEEVTQLRREKEAIRTFLRMCRGMQKPVRGEVEFQHSVDLHSKRLDEVVIVEKRSLQTFYSLSPELKEFVHKMHSFKDSSIFQQFWEESVEKVGEKYERDSSEEDEEIVPELGLNDILNCIIRPCFNSYAELYDELRSGSLTLSAVDRIFQEFIGHPERLKAELNTICELRPAEDRGWVDHRVQQIQQYHEMNSTCEAAKIIDCVKESLGLSGDFSILENLLHITQKLDSISPELVQAKQILEGITQPRCSCLRELARQKEFVCWVREALKDINELKVFVDLASISAGENDMDVDRVACFHGAVHGYSSLLYELHQGSGFEDFMRCLEKLWRALDSDKSLPKKLRASAQHLEWLKTVKESHGSVELSSLSLAAAINSRGVYVLRAPADGQKVSLDSVLRFTLPATSGDTETSQKYSLAELRELQNKLMLMSAKGEQGLEVERFSEVFSNVQRLAQAFIDLYSAGNMLFRSWLAQVYCSPHRESCVFIDFSLGPIPVLEGQGDMAAVLPALCKTMESFLESWKSFMNARRCEHFYLNYYSAEQLVFLCLELGRGSPSQAALMMLSFLNPHCTEQDALTTLRSQCPPISGKAASDFQVLLDGERDLSARLKRIWECYMSNMGSFLPSCLDIDTLGLWLKNLASSGRECITRDFPQDLLCVGQPNLILCPRSEVLSSALAIYMNSPEQPLPTFDEVLLCTPQTSAEQVGLFLHRCLIPCQGGNKIYTMLYADELSYEVSCRAEELFQHLQCCNSSYRLVILCNCERENSYLPSAFSHYKVHMIPQRSQEDIQQYLQRHFRVAQPSSSAAAVFKEHMCVGIVSSKRAGMGKSLYVKRLHERLQKDQPDCTELLKTIRLIEPEVDEDKVLKSLLPFLEREHQTKPMIFHFDITSSVQRGIPEFLFKLLVLQYLTDNNGNMWLRQKCHLYIIEILELSPVPKTAARHVLRQKYHFLDVFPKIMCKSPKEVLDMETLENHSGDVGMDMEEFRSEAFQRPFQYLKRFDQGCDLDRFRYKVLSVEGRPAECVQHFLLHCGVVDPSWAELRNFTWFLNVQLRDCEASVFCDPGFVGDTLNGFKSFVVGFMILMARDFATPSLSISDQSSGRQSSHLENVTEEDLLPFRIRKRWESEPHPYLFFNADHTSMTFMGFHIQQTRNHIDAIDPLNGNVIKKDIMTARLYQGLLLQGVLFNVPFNQLPRKEKLERLCMVLGLPKVFDPDKTYELTTDNVLKILAIEMRFRCNIPVVIMGETGCGKTRLVKFLCQLRSRSAEVENMKLVKVHGGTTAEMIYARIREAEALAKSNKEQHGLDTVLFFDEANTTEAVSSIKEVLCDRTVQGEPLASDSGLRIIAACNPYRKHTDRMIRRLELAGLGYRVKADDTREKLGSIPLRQLVYRVHALPPSMIPLVWDFGQLNNHMEKMYIQQMVQHVAEQLPMAKDEVRTVTEVLFASQQYMRQMDDECSFVSLRDVERCMEVFKWFYRHSHMLLMELTKYLAERKAPKHSGDRNNVIWSLVLAVSVCYHASLERKEPYRTAISQVLPKPYNTQKKILEEISLMQDLFLSGVPLQDTIARNLALKENVFMMVICIELKIPLFLVGKPGSSKSLAKTIVADAMQGQAAHSDLFKHLKQIHLVSFQCSPLSTPEGIIGTFKHCARFQEGKNLKEYVSVVVLDEIGLAEDSPKMPLKTLHPLLEDGCIDDVPDAHKKVGFIGISNWALDPAKMNRGIFVSRGDPSREELIKSAEGICCSARGALQKVEQYFQHFADAYENICKAQDREFFGLRDYYSLIKMFFALAKSSNRDPTLQDIATVVLRNFGGKDDVNALEIFTSKLPEKGEIRACDISRIELIRQNIYSSAEDGDCRYLLVLTENYAALQILQQTFFTAQQQPEIIFGSSFPKDQEYTQICRNINRVKVCMETGQMVVLLNLQNLYESLYDALNQYYVYLAGQKYVDLGLGTHRVKCRVHPKFQHRWVCAALLPLFPQVTTFSRLLTSADAACLGREVQGKAQRPQILFLQQFDTEYSFLKCIREFLDSTSENKVLIIQTDFEDGSKDAQLITSAKYAVVNEINKVDLGEVSVFVYFIMKLSRLEGGTSYMGFHGGLWQSVHIDDLRRSKYMISDLTALQNLTISQVLSQDQGATRGELCAGERGSCGPRFGTMGTDGEILDTTVLLRTCVQSAVRMLRDQNEDLSRSRRRIEILLGLFSKEDELKASFLKITKSRLSSLLKKQEENSLHPENWVFREASNLSALQEAGTFRHALWKRVQKVVTPFLALLVAVMDRNGNLELLARAGTNWVTNLWMFIFNDTKFLSQPSTGSNPRGRGMLFIIVVQNNMTVSADAGNEMPFSWRIKEYLEEMWVETQYIQNTEGHAEKFVEYFQKTALGKFISVLTGEERQLLFECYIRDFIVLTLSVSSQEQLQCLRVAFLSCVKEWMAESPWTKELVPSLPWAHLAHNQFKSRLQNFSRILAVYPCVTGYLLTQEERRIPCSEMVLDVLAAMVCAEELEKLVQTASPELWLQGVKNLHMPIEFLCKEESAQRRGSHCHQLLRKLRACWSRVFAMALFVEHVLLDIHTVMPEFEDLVRKYTLLLAKCFQHDSDIKSHPTFSAVLRVLHECKDELYSLLFLDSRHGLEVCPICLGEPKDPVCLPCNHVFCHKCISQWLVPAQMYCPYCRAVVEDLEGSVFAFALPRAAIAKKALFRQRCNNFFIDMVTTMCFKDNKPPEPQVIQSLLDLLFVERKTVLKDTNHSAVYTKFLSPFHDEVDKTPIIRSVMLKLLLKYSFNEVKDDVQRYLSQVEHSKLLEKNDKKELYLLFVNCLEDSMCEKLEDSLGCGHGNSLPEDRTFPENYLPASSREAPQEASVEYLQAVAEVRLCLSRADMLPTTPEEGKPEQMKEMQRYLKNVEEFCNLARNDWHRVYLVRRIASQHGMAFAQKLVTEPRFSWVFPVQHSQYNHMDRYLVYGERYWALRDAVGRAMMEGTAQGLLEASSSPPALESAHLLLAIFREVTALYGNPSLHPKQQQTEVMTRFIQCSRVLNSPELKLLAVALVKNTLPGLVVEPQGHSQQGALVEMAVHMAAVLLCGHSLVLQPLRNLAFQPDTMQNSFLPTMPEDMMAQARTWEGMHGLHWYECPKGHPCTVGECGRPMEKSRCPECHVIIGGRNHVPVKGFRRSRWAFRCRWQESHRWGCLAGQSSVCFVLPWMFLASLGRMIKPTVDDVVSFLQQHIQEDLAQLTRILGKSVDDTINILHLVLSSLLQNLDKKLLKLNRQIQEDERISSNPIVKIVYGDPAAFLSQLPQDSHIHHSRMWSCRRRVSVENLGHIVQQKNAKDTVPLLWKFLQKESELRLVKFLPEILALQKDLVRQFQNTAEIKDCSIREFFREPHSGVMRDLLERRVNVFLSVWNKLRSSLDTNGEIKLPESYCNAELSLDSRLEVLLPRRQGLGLCSTALASYLIGLHNDFVYSVIRDTEEDDRYLVSPSEVADLHLISYDVERDLIPLILSNCQYSMEKGGETLQDFDLERIQQQVISKFLQGKPLIRLTGIPTLVYRHDRNNEQLFSDVRNKLEQTALPSSVMNMISGELQSYSDVCDALSLTEITLSFLAVAGENADMLLTDYIEEVLQMGDQTDPHLLQALRRCQLRHSIALWQLLCAHKSEQLLRLGRDPFADVSRAYKEELTPELVKLLHTFLVHSSLETFLQELHEMIILKLRGVQAVEEFNPMWSLKESLLPYLDAKGSELAAELEDSFPDEILLSHAAGTWKAAAVFKREHRDS